MLMKLALKRMTCKSQWLVFQEGTMLAVFLSVICGPGIFDFLKDTVQPFQCWFLRCIAALLIQKTY